MSRTLSRRDLFSMILTQNYKSLFLLGKELVHFPWVRIASLQNACWRSFVKIPQSFASLRKMAALGTVQYNIGLWESLGWWEGPSPKCQPRACLSPSAESLKKKKVPFSLKTTWRLGWKSLILSKQSKTIIWIRQQTVQGTSSVVISKNVSKGLYIARSVRLPGMPLGLEFPL